MVIYLFRHSQPDPPPDVCYGQSNIPLIPWHFEHTVKRLRRLLPVQPRDTIYSSPLKRCVLLAKSLTKGPCRVKVDKRLSEMHFGEWEMKTWNDIDDQGLLRWCKNHIDEKAPGGESFKELYRRVCDFWDDITGGDEERVFICTHGAAMKAILTHIFEMPLKNSSSWQLHYGDAIRIEKNDHHPYLVEFLSQ